MSVATFVTSAKNKVNCAVYIQHYNLKASKLILGDKNLKAQLNRDNIDKIGKYY